MGPLHLSHTTRFRSRLVLGGVRVQCAWCLVWCVLSSHETILYPTNDINTPVVLIPVYINSVRPDSSSYHIRVHITTVMKLLVDKASVPAGGPLIFLPVVDERFRTCWWVFHTSIILLTVTADVSLQVCHS